MTDSNSPVSTQGTAFGQWLKARRSALRLTRKELALNVDCSPETVHKFETGARRPSKQIAAILADFFSIPAEEREAFISFARGEAGEQGMPDREHPWRAARRRASNLPAQMTSLIGRESNVEEVRALLLRPAVRLVTLVGPPGIGKTRLALEVSARLLDHFDDGISFVPLAPVTEPGMVIPAMAKVLGVKETPGQPLPETIRRQLEEKRSLLVLDNFEQVIEAGPEVARLLAGCPWLKVLVTSRESLHLYGERQYPVPGLEVPSSGAGGERAEGGGQRAEATRAGSRELGVRSWESGETGKEAPVAVIERFAAVELFVERAQGVMPSFALDYENAEAVGRICAHLGGLPLAIELAAARVGSFSPREMLQMLTDSLGLLTEGARDLPQRHQTLQAAIEWSYRLLSDAEQRLFRRLGVFMQGCTAAAAQAVVGSGQWAVGRGDGSRASGNSVLSIDHSELGTRNSELEIQEGLASLVGKSLLQVGRATEAAEGEARFSMLETIREYAVQRLEESGEAEDTRGLHAEYFLGLAEAAQPELRGAQQTTWVERLQGEYDNLRTSLAWLCGQGVGADGGETEETRRGWRDMAVRMSSALGRFWLMRGLISEGRQWLGESLAQVDFEQDALLKPWHLTALNMAGAMAAMQGDTEGANALVERSMLVARRLGDRPSLARSLNNLGIIARRQGNYALAEEYCVECLKLYRSLEDKMSTAASLNNLGIVAHIRGKYEAAHAYVAESIELRREIGDKTGLGISLENQANMYREEGDFRRAGALLDESRAIFEEVGNPPQRLHALAATGQLLCEEGNYERAAPLLQESLEMARAIGEQSQTGNILTCLGRIALNGEDYSAAHALLQEAFTSFVEAGEYNVDLVDVLEWIGVLEAARGFSGERWRFERCVSLLSAAEAQRGEMGAPRPPVSRQQSRALEGLRRGLREEEFERARARGLSMTLRDAVEYARGESV